MATKTFTEAEIAQHNTDGDLWIVVRGKVFDVSKFAKLHPGGKKVLLGVGGKDATSEFAQFHSQRIFDKYVARLVIGEVAGGAQGSAAPPVTAVPPSVSPKDVFGSPVPFAEPAWCQGSHSPYYKASHVQWRNKLRAFVESDIMPFTHEWDEDKAVPRDLFTKLGAMGFLATVIGRPFPAQYVPDVAPPGGAEFDAFHELISYDEICRCASGGVAWALCAGICIGLPPVINFGSEFLKNKVVRDCVLGKKIICLAISEPSAASDVANIRTTAVRQGDHYIVNGEKKWITNGTFADYFTVAVRTGKEGMGGLSLLLVERSMPGVNTRQMKCSGVWPSGTAFVTFENVRVPVTHLIGSENQGFKVIMYNFNHERWMLACQASRFSRVLVEEAFRYAHERKTFGKRLIDHPVIRWKLAEMIRQVEATHAWVEHVTHQLNTMTHEESMRKLGGACALLKVQTTKVFEFCAREAAQVFGGAAYTRGGKGEKVERLYREVRAYAIPGGSEEILLDLGVRQAMKAYDASL